MALRTQLAALLLAATQAQPPPDPTVCETVLDCIARARAVADPDSGISAGERAVAERLQSLAPQSIEPVVGLLEHANEDVRELAGYILRDMPGLQPRHLPALQRAVEAGDGWLPPAIASIGTPEAIRFLLKELEKKPEIHTQLTWALVRLGPRVVPELLEFYRCGTGCDVDLLRAVGFILSELGDQAGEGVTPLVRIATDGGASLVARRAALQALAGLRRTARDAVKPLLEMTRQEPRQLQDDARRALLAIGGPDAKNVLVSSLDSETDRTSTLGAIAALGARGREAGPRVLELLGSDDSDVRVAAARTLGLIGHRSAGHALAAALKDPDDWRLVYAAAEALGRLQATEARRALEAMASEHWYPPVRDAAATAVRALDGEHRYKAASAAILGFFTYGDAEHRPRTCANEALYPPSPTQAGTLDPGSQPELADRLAYDREMRSYDDKGEHITRRRTIPMSGQRVEGGWLLSNDAGEWGGELVFKSDSGQTTVLLNQNTKAIHALRTGQLVAVTGLAHLFLDRGDVYRVTCAPTNKCSATWWKALPGAPTASRLIDTGQLLIDTTGGSVLLAPDGELVMARCESRVTPRREH